MIFPSFEISRMVLPSWVAKTHVDFSPHCNSPHDARSNRICHLVSRLLQQSFELALQKSSVHAHPLYKALAIVLPEILSEKERSGYPSCSESHASTREVSVFQRVKPPDGSMERSVFFSYGESRSVLTARLCESPGVVL